MKPAPVTAAYVMKFNPGKVVVTRGVHALMADDQEFALHVYLSLNRHLAGDWGNVGDKDRALNEAALLEGERLMSVYTMEGVPPIWIISERDRSVTTVLFPDEY